MRWVKLCCGDYQGRNDVPLIVAYDTETRRMVFHAPWVSWAYWQVEPGVYRKVTTGVSMAPSVDALIGNYPPDRVELNDEEKVFIATTLLQCATRPQRERWDALDPKYELPEWTSPLHRPAYVPEPLPPIEPKPPLTSEEKRAKGRKNLTRGKPSQTETGTA